MISTSRLRESSGKNSAPFLATQYFDEVAVIFEFAAEVTPGVSGAHDCLVEQLPAAIRLFFYQTEQINTCAGADFNAKQITVRCDFMIQHGNKNPITARFIRCSQLWSVAININNSLRLFLLQIRK